MKKFLFKFFLLVIILFFGVLLGMQEANQGLLQMKGFNDHTYGEAFNIQKNENGGVEAAVLGKEITAYDIEEKQKKLEEMKAFHFFSNLGNKLADLLTLLFQNIVNIVITVFDKVFS